MWGKSLTRTSQDQQITTCFINTGDNKVTKTLFYYGIFQSFNTKTAAIQDL